MERSDRDFRLTRDLDKKLPDIWFHDVLPLFEAGASDARIYKQFPDLPEKKLHRARAYYYAKIYTKPNSRPLRVLCDENISNAHLRSCQTAFNYATSIGIETKNGICDQDVWDYACDAGFDVIVTRDQRTSRERDLTRIAVCAWHNALSRQEPLPRLPVIMHVTGNACVGRHFQPILTRNLGTLFEVCSALSVPVLRLNEAGLHKEIGREDIESILFGPKQSRQKISRQEQWARYFLRRILPSHQWSDRDTAAVQEVKRTITKAISIAEYATGRKHKPVPQAPAKESVGKGPKLRLALVASS